MAADEGLGVLVQESDTDRAADARAVDSDGEAARDQVGDGVVGGVDQDAAARVGLRTAESVVALSPIYAQVVSFTPTYETEPPTAAVPATAPAAAIDRTSPLGVRFDRDIAQGSHRGAVVDRRRGRVVDHHHDDPRRDAGRARDRECGGNPQERGVVAGRDQDRLAGDGAAVARVDDSARADVGVGMVGQHARPSRSGSRRRSLKRRRRRRRPARRRSSRP